MKKIDQIKESMVVVREKMEDIKLECLKHVIVLKGYNNDGKTSVLKCLIEELYNRNPQNWVGKQKFNPEKVDVEKSKGEYRAVFNYKGIIIAIKTAGDTRDIIIKNFQYFGKCKVSIAITAVRVHEKNRADIVAEHTYSEINSMRSFVSHEISIEGMKLRTKAAEMKVVNQIIGELDKLVMEVAK
jgi:hypothetical protein